MAQRRMFSKAIAGSARFLKMPVDSQNLYFHLGLAADDDGVVEAWSVLKTTGTSEDNLKVLASKGFIKVLNEDLVSYILDWNENNDLRADRITPSQYRELLVQIIPEIHLKQPKRRADLKPLPPGRPVDNQRTEEDRIGKDRILNTGELKNSQESDSFEDEFVYERTDREGDPLPTKEKIKPDRFPERDIKAGFALFGPGTYSMYFKNITQRDAIKRLIENKGLKQVEIAVKFSKNHKDDQFCPKISTPNDLLMKWDKLISYRDKLN